MTSMLELVSITVSDNGAKPEEAFGRRRCFEAKPRCQVDVLHYRVAGGADERRPGLRDHASYHGAFLRDPDGNRVCHLVP
jgi:hypothetical protein